ncbi:protocadherin alpha-7-like isoform X4 [Polyodon spathula]|uniref:protocadherin alpha-7-like isoform X4 n=1 Tax=Polyodon spathula TaxID=7913 RepID=UPI001B7E7FF8|nr:protocadherin alpha-7-like isoform X4 [Polyodon spathula]
MDLFTMMIRAFREQWTQRWVIFVFAFAVCFWKAGAQIRYSIPEELNSGAFVGNIAKDLGLDISRLEDRRFRIVSGSNQQLLQVNQKTGVLFVNHNIDRETLCDRNSNCFINLKTVVENPLEIHYVGVEILDINDNAPSFQDKEKRLEIPESTLSGARFPLEGAHDPDIGINSLSFYQLSKNEHFELDVKDRGDDNKIPVLLLQKHLDREHNTEHNLLLTAFDGGTPARLGTLNITVIVLDINDNPPVFDQEVYLVSLQENVPIGTFVIKVNATDLDEGLNGVVEYSFGNTFRSKASELFDLDSNTGEITVKGLIDFEEKESYEIDVQATDKGQSPLTVHCSVVVQIQDLNDNTPEIEVTSLSRLISEDAKPGTVIALISVTDRDSDINGKIVCRLSEHILFELKQSFQDNGYSLLTKAQLDREISSQYNITITAQDLGNPSLSSFKTITVKVLDINDNSPRFTQDPYTFYVLENNAPGASIFSVSAFDLDQNENARVSYHVMADQVLDKPVSSLLGINSDNGNVYAIRSFDFEELKNFTFKVLAKDSGVPSLSSNVTVNVFILDQNDNAPVILSPSSKDGFVEAVETIPRNVKTGYLVTKVRAHDADIGYNAWLSFSLQQATDPTLFGLERNTGAIRTLRPLTETDATEHKLIIVVKDSGNYSLSTTATIRITTVENTEAFAFSDFKSNTKQQEGNNITFYLIITLGSISSLFVVSIITLIAIQCHRPRDYINAKFSRDTNYAEVSGNGSLCHSYQYRAAEKHFMFVGPAMNIGSASGVGSNRNTLVIPDNGMKTSGEPRQPNTDWRYSASLRAGIQSSVLMEESAVLQGAPVVHVQNWPTVSSATLEPDAGEVSPPVGAGINSNSWTFKYGPGNHRHQQQQQHQLKPGEVPENFIIPGSPAIISIRQDQAGAVDGKGDFITFGKKEETKKKKKKKKGKADKKDKGSGNNDNSDH